MVDYIEILRLSSDPKNSQRCIASIVHSSRHTIRDVLEAAKKAGISWPLDKAVTNDTGAPPRQYCRHRPPLP